MVVYTVPKETWVRLLKHSKYIMLYMYNKHITSLILATIYLSLLLATHYKQFTYIIKQWDSVLDLTNILTAAYINNSIYLPNKKNLLKTINKYIIKIQLNENYTKLKQYHLTIIIKCNLLQTV